MEVSAAALWLIAGGVLFAIEVFFAPTMILAFFGLGAVTTGILIALGVFDQVLHQASSFFGSTIVWAAVLWKPLKSLYQPGVSGYNDIAGQLATVGEKGLEKGKKGEVHWSGTIWAARLSPASKLEKVENGREVVIEKSDGGVLIVKEPEDLK